MVYANKAQKLRFGEPCSEAETQARLNRMPEAERVNRRKLARDAMQSSASFKRGWVDGQRLFSLTNKGVASHESFMCFMYKASIAGAWATRSEAASWAGPHSLCQQHCLWPLCTSLALSPCPSSGCSSGRAPLYASNPQQLGVSAAPGQHLHALPGSRP